MKTELEAILTGTRAFPRRRAPEPLLLPRIASVIAVERLELVCRTVGEVCTLSRTGGRGAVPRATAEAIAARRDELDGGLLTDLQRWLPELAPVLRGESVGEDPVVRRFLDALDDLDATERWQLLDGLFSLHLQIDAATIERLTAEPPPSDWLAALVVSRAAGRLDPPRIASLEGSLRRLDYPWSRRARDLLAGGEPAPTAFALVTRALPYDRRLAELLAIEPDQGLLVDILWRMREQWGGRVAEEAPPVEASPDEDLTSRRPPMLGIDDPVDDFGDRFKGDRDEPVGAEPGPEFEIEAEAEAAEPAEEAPPEPAAERYLQTQVHADLGGPPTETWRSFVAGRKHRLNFWIGPPGRGIAADLPVDEPEPDEEERRAGVIELRLVLEYAGAFQEDRIVLPLDRSRPSQATRDFEVEVGADQQVVTADLWLLHKGRVVQNLEIGGPVTAEHLPGEPDHPRRGIRITERLVVRPLPDVPAGGEFGSSLVQHGGQLVGFTPAAARYDLIEAKDLVRKINDRLNLVARALVRASDDGTGVDWVDDADDAEVLDLLRFMAAQGNQLHARLDDLGLADAPDPIQLVNSDPEDLVPIEYVYDKGHPKEGAKLCDGWQEALREERSECGCDNRPGEVAETICPFGFWALSKRIERQQVAPHAAGERPAAHSVAASASASGAGATLRDLTSAVFASSGRVKDLDVATMRGKLASCFPQRHSLAGGWADWCRAVEQRPGLLLLLPHQGEEAATETPFLEISDAVGKEDRLLAGNVKREHVNPDASEPGPIVLLLGCKTAEAGLLPFNAFAQAFQAKRASIVVATLAKVLGRHATPVAAAFLDELIAASASGESFATVMRTVRRRMFAAGYLISLCLVAYGDGEWKLAPPQAADPGGADVPT